MHRLVVLKRSGIHRYACLALYRALLRQCRHLPATVPHSNTIKFLIPKKFHKYKNIDSPSQAVSCLEAGYKALDLLHSASQGDQRCVARIISLIEESEAIKKRESAVQGEMARAKRAIPITASQKKREETTRQQSMTARRHPDATSVFERPRRVIRGERRVPAFVNARGVPMLRIKKPQPMFLSSVIRTKLNRRENWVAQSESLKVDMLFAQDEDLWDKLTVPPDTVSWAKAFKDSIADIKLKISRMDSKSFEVAREMWDVVLRERKLAAHEKKQRSLGG